MKNFIFAALCSFSAAVSLSSCIAEEPLNMECDITSIKVDASEIFYNAGDELLSIEHETMTYPQDTLVFITRIDANIGAYPVSLESTEGSTAYLCDVVSNTYSDDQFKPFTNGDIVDFSQGDRVFRIVSQDKAWHRDYFVRVVRRKATGGDMLFDFNTYILDPQYAQKFYIWEATDENAFNGLFQASPYWCNGNPGYKLCKSSAKPEDYPSSPEYGGGPDGSDCVKMETKDTGSFGKMAGLLMASGSMFNGTFDVANALKNALKATKFSTPFTHKPVSMSFDAKFEAGDKYQDSKGKLVEGLVDEPDAYIVMYRNTDADGNKIIIDGNNVLNDPSIVGLARLPHNYSATLNVHGTHDLPGNNPIHGVTSEWQHFTLVMQYSEEIDPVLLENNGYNLCIGFSSSWQGAYFEGAVGTKFWIDNVRVECEE